MKVAARKMGSKGRSVLTGSDWRAMTNTFDPAISAVPRSLHAPIGLRLTEAGIEAMRYFDLAEKPSKTVASNAAPWLREGRPARPVDTAYAG